MDSRHPCSFAGPATRNGTERSRGSLGPPPSYPMSSVGWRWQMGGGTDSLFGDLLRVGLSRVCCP